MAHYLAHDNELGKTQFILLVCPSTATKIATIVTTLQVQLEGIACTPLVTKIHDWEYK
jgi:hypothetical protein